ncbi:MAG: HlyD family secretion protein [Gammaproteobacteria bacterium]
MSKTLYSHYWYRVADLKPELRSHTSIHRHHYRGQRWYVLQDHASGSYHRFSQAAYFLIGHLNGELTVDALWNMAVDHLGDAAPTQDETIQLLGQLHAADVLKCDVQPDSLELFERFQKHQQNDWKQRLRSPLSIRIPLLDPEKLLSRWLHLVRPLFNRAVFLVWLGVVLSATVLAGMHWGAITDNILDQVMSPRNLILLWLTYPLIKGLHELGHAFATKIWGGEVHEMGIMFLVLLPIPYVDASAASAFPDKRQRMVVGMAGMMVELLLAALALFVWLNVESGMVSVIAYNIMLIGSVSTLFFNGNPLLKFDGYYVLSDAIEIPNLAQRSNRHLGYLIQRYLFGNREVESPATTRGEGAWFVFYGMASFGYRMFIMCVILLYVASKFFVVGVVLAIWAATSQVVMPLLKNIKFLFYDPQLRHKRTRVIGSSLGAGLVLGWLLFFMPVGLRTHADGVVWLPDESRVRAGTDCFVTRLLATPDTTVQPGQALIECADPLLQTRVALLDARLRELQARYSSELTEDQVKAEITKDGITAAAAELARARQQLDKLVIASQAHGTLIIPQAGDLPGRYVKQGDVLAYILDDNAVSVRVVVTQAKIALVRQHTEGIEVRLSNAPGDTVQARIKREIPAATDRLPSKALGTAGGGNLAVDPQDEAGVKSLEKVFQFEIELEQANPSEFFGQRLYARFDHGAEPLALQWQRSLRQLFMRRFDV